MNLTLHVVGWLPHSKIHETWEFIVSFEGFTKTSVLIVLKFWTALMNKTKTQESLVSRPAGIGEGQDGKI